MALNLLSPAEIKSISFLDSTKSTRLPKLPGPTLTFFCLVSERMDFREESKKEMN